MNAALVRVHAGIPKLLQQHNVYDSARGTMVGRVPLPLACKQVYDVLADGANALGEVCGLSVAEIAARARLSERQVYRALRRLVAVRLVTLYQSGGGRGRTAVYRLRCLFAAWLALRRGISTAAAALRVTWKRTREVLLQFSTGKGDPIGRGIPREYNRSRSSSGCSSIVSQNYESPVAEGIEPSSGERLPRRAFGWALARGREAFARWEESLRLDLARYGLQADQGPGIESAVSAFAGCLAALGRHGRIHAGESLGRFAEAFAVEFRVRGRFDRSRPRSECWELADRALARMEQLQRFGTNRGAAYYLREARA